MYNLYNALGQKQSIDDTVYFILRSFDPQFILDEYIPRYYMEKECEEIRRLVNEKK